MQSPGDSIDVDAVTVMEHGYDVQFLCELESRLMCPICLLIMRSAVQTLCGHRFCEACIKRVIVDGSAVLTCPVDKTISKVDQVFPDVATRREILCLPIKCNNSTEGCTWRGELIEMPNHQSTCGLERVPCTHGCGTRIRRTEIDQHMTQCPSRQVLCLFCCERVPHSKMISHTEQCPKAPVTCSMCGKDDLLRDELSSHQDIDSGSCPKSIIHCPYSYTGCTYKAERSKIQEHITENGTLGKHMELVARKLNEQCNIIKEFHEKLNNAVTQSNDALSLVMITQRSQAQMTKELRDRNVTGRLHWKVKVGQQRNIRTSYCSPAFYTGCPGYKVQLTLDMDGQKDGQVRYTSISVSLLPGEYDEEVVFPFNGTCYVTLYDQMSCASRRINLNHEIVLREVPRNYNRSGRHGERLFRRENNKFVKRQDLLSSTSRYMKQGYLHLEVLVVHSFYPPLEMPQMVAPAAACFTNLVGHGSFLIHSPQRPQLRPASPMTPPVMGVTTLAIGN